MKPIGKETIKAHAELCMRLGARFSDLQESVEVFNTAMHEAWESVEKELSAYNEAIEDANQLRQEIAGDIQSYIDDRSEKWQEGENGQRYAEWLAQYQEDLPTAELLKPDELTTDDIEDAGKVFSDKSLTLD